MIPPFPLRRVVIMPIGTCIAAICVMAGSVRAEEHICLRQDDSLKSAALSAIALTYNDHFADAESVLVQMADASADCPLAPMLLAGTIHAGMLDSESHDRRGDFRRWLTETHRRALALSADDPQSASEAAFAQGMTLAYDAAYEAHFGGRFATIKKGIRARNRFNETLAADSSFIDAYFGLGSYNYWKAAATDFINWLPLIPDKRDLGMEQLSRAIHGGTFARAAARAALAWALFNDERFDEAYAHGDTLRAEFPDGKGPLWIMAQSGFALYHWDQAHDLFDEIEERIRLDGPGNYYNLVECGWYRARCDYESGRWRDALNECLSTLAYPIPKAMHKRQKKKLQDLRDMKRDLKTMLNSGALTDFEE